MMKNIKFFSLAALLMAGAAFTACSNDNDVADEKQQTVKEGTYTLTIQAGKNITRALAVGDSNSDGINDIIATWATTENVYVQKGSTWAEGSLQPQEAGTSTMLKGTLSGISIAANDELTLQFPKSGAISYAGQVGTLADIAANFDYATATVEVASVSATGNIIPKAAMTTFTNLQAIVKFTLIDKATDAAISATQLVVSDGTNTYTVTPASATSEIYVALPGFSGQTVTLTATAGGNTYSYEKTGVSFTNGQYYEIGVKMSPIISLLDRTYYDDELVIADGYIVTGSAPGLSCKVAVADGATVTLRDVENTGDLNGGSTTCPGIRCIGNATIILEGNNTVRGGGEYAGIYVPEDKTLTIRGTGSLTVTGGSGGAGIGGNQEGNCGSIVISGGTVTATGGSGGAGIGLGANGGECKDITISGGTITAEGGSHGAGIGLGSSGGFFGEITISGGTVTATGCDEAPGIGGVEGVYESITITGDVTKVTVNKGSSSTYSIGIEDDYSWEDCGPITIGGTVYFDEGNFTNNDLTTSTFVYQP
jgi:hypothetical protein